MFKRNQYLLMRSTALLIACMLCVIIKPLAQKANMEQYYQTSKTAPSQVFGIAGFNTKNNWHTELRYNYDALESYSLYFGKTFSKENDFSYSITTMLGGVAGRYQGVSVASNIDLDYKNFYLSSQLQYTSFTNWKQDNYFYNWSEVGYQPTDWFYFGTALQHTWLSKENGLSAGILGSLCYKNFSLPLYVFSPLSKEPLYIFSLVYEWKSNKKNKPANKLDITK